MSTDALSSPESNTQRYEAVLRISEALVACREPEELARVLADQLGEFLSFDHLDVMVLRRIPQKLNGTRGAKEAYPLARICRPRTCQDGTLTTPRNLFTLPTGTPMNDSSNTAPNQ